MKKTITIIGAGSVGTALAHRFYEKGHSIQQVFSRQKAKAQKLAAEVEAKAVDQLQDIEPNAQYYILAVHDDAIAQVAQQLTVIKQTDAIIAHSSGATPMAALASCRNYGVFYPLQTFSTSIPPDFEELPFCITANTEENRQQLFELASSICPNVYTISEAQRQRLHVAAVVVNNFSNHLFALADRLCRQEQLDFEILKPLIRQTLRKIEQSAPEQVQTGPAARGDRGTIERHLDWLDLHAPELKTLYTELTENILKLHER